MRVPFLILACLENSVDDILLEQLKIDMVLVLVSHNLRIDMQIDVKQQLFYSFSELVFGSLAYLIEAQVDREDVVSMPIQFDQTKSEYVMVILIFLVFKNLHKRLSIE